ncbi:MAG: phosphoribosylamine--glycine ligase [Anaerolineae bacterium]|jgi:phosphoribosylamine--glycine ligase/phosphoribosylformylglycinamidine cyclo-ligase|nr:phosphoribosylamine--glycine ligase [Anaerolineae bacterium]
MVVGSGGREHALAWALSRSPRVEAVFLAPGNGSTQALATNVAVDAGDVAGLVAVARRERIDLTVVGPEAPLVTGLVDALHAAGLRAFGPVAAAARLEGSKAFAKRFMIEEGIPTGVGAIFDDHGAARAYLARHPEPVVVKASGLAAGKGVMVCATRDEAEEALRRIMVERAFGAAGDEVLVEECLAGEEASLLAFSDGRTVVPMLPARDYKRAGEGDRGPNTGGMGCYAPSPHLPPALVDEVLARVLQPAVDAMRRRGTPYVGVLYAGLMLTGAGPRVLEFNCRFGDPETQVLLPLLETDLAEILLACVEGRLHAVDVRWKEAHAVTVVMAARGYPGAYERGQAIAGVDDAAAVEGAVVFGAGTASVDGRLVTNGGRILAVTAVAPDHAAARERAYRAVDRIDFAGAQLRRDIGAGIAVAPAAPAGKEPAAGAYAGAGVDIDAGNRAVALMRDAVRSTHTPAVLSDIGLFGGLFALHDAVTTRDPVLVASTDSVGTKTIIAAATGRFEGIGHDLVNHCANDVLVQGARPLFFLDYFASTRLDPEQVAAAVGGCAAACRALGCALVGGETAELPGVYRPGEFDLVGAIVGWVEREAIVDGRGVRPGHVCLGLPSSGLHTNGYSLARRVLGGLGWDTVLPDLGESLADCLLRPHRAYLREVEALWDAGVTIEAMAHITGGGFVENLPRVLPAGVGVEIDRAAWQVPAIFRLIRRLGRVSDGEMFRVFNMGIGMVLILPPDQAHRALAVLPEAMVVGRAMGWDGHGSRVRI